MADTATGSPRAGACPHLSREGRRGNCAQFFAADGDASELFDELKETLDEIALGVEGEVAIASDLAVRFWRDDRLVGSGFEALDKGGGVVALVAEEGFGLHFGHQSFSLGDVLDLAAGEAERQRVGCGGNRR